MSTGERSSQPHGSHGGRAHRWLIWLCVTALAGYLFFLSTKMTAVVGAADSSGYLNGARLLAAGQLQAELRLPPEFRPPTADDQKVFTPLGFITSPDPTRMIPAYGTGLSLHFALGGRLMGWNVGPLVIELLAAAFALALCYLVAREVGVSAPLSAAGAAVLAACPIFLFTSIQALSDTLATAWCLAAFHFGLRARLDGRWAVACGMALSMGVLVRFTNVLLAPALLVLLGVDWRKLIRFVIGGVPGAVWLAFYNYRQFGGIFATGYGDVGADFSTANGVPTLIHFARWLAVFLPAILLALPIAALAARATRGRELCALAFAILPIAGFYLFYDISQQVWWALRYILPAVPFLIIAGLLGLEALAPAAPRRWARAFRPVAALVIAGWAVVSSLYWTPRLHVFMVQHYEQTYADAAHAARDRFPPDALVVTNNFSGPVYYYTDFPVLRADVVEANEFARYAAIARQAGRPIRAVLFDFEEEEAFRRCPGRWIRLSTLANVGFWALESQ